MSEKRRALGRGLGALIPNAPVSPTSRPVDVFFPDQRPAATDGEAPAEAGAQDAAAAQSGAAGGSQPGGGSGPSGQDAAGDAAQGDAATSQVAEEVRNHFPEQVLRGTVPRSVRISEAPSHGQTVMTYDPNSSGALSYLGAAAELADRGATPTTSASAQN